MFPRPSLDYPRCHVKSLGPHRERSVGWTSFLSSAGHLWEEAGCLCVLDKITLKSFSNEKIMMTAGKVDVHIPVEANGCRILRKLTLSSLAHRRQQFRLPMVAIPTSLAPVFTT